jgi:pilus assembly protein CpaB
MATPSTDATRRWLTLHRRPVAGGCAFVAVLLGLSALSSPSQQPSAESDAGEGLTIPAGQLAVPVRLADSAVASLLQPGDQVDVFAADGRSGARVVASRVTVAATPTTDEGPSWTGDEGFVVLLAMPGQAGALAAASAGSPLTLALHPE